MSPSEKKARESAPRDTKFEVRVSRKTLKSLANVPETIFDIFELLRDELAVEGPVQKEWPNYGMLRKQAGQKATERRYHCHLKKGRPTYVACWSVMKKSIIIDVYYVGTHEKAPY